MLRQLQLNNLVALSPCNRQDKNNILGFSMKNYRNLSLLFIISILVGCDQGGAPDTNNFPAKQADSEISHNQSKPSKAQIKDDFAGVSFDWGKTELESNGFLCKEEEKDLTMCHDFGRSGTLVGFDYRGVSVAVPHTEKRRCISTKMLVSSTPDFNSMQLISNLNAVYTSTPEFDSSNSAVSFYNWVRPDGSKVFLSVITVLEANAQLRICSKEHQPKKVNFSTEQ
jgi:hypothetical protein